MVTAIYIVRHGQSAENIRFSSQKHKSARGALTDLGIEQAQGVAKHLKHVSVAAVYSSHLLRAYQTASLIARELCVPVRVMRGLQERKIRLDPKTMKQLWYTPTALYGNPDTLRDTDIWEWKPFDKMESEREAMNRFTKTLHHIRKQNDGKSVVVVTHGQLMRAFLVHIGYCAFRDIPFIREGSVENAAGIHVELEGDGFVLRNTWGIHARNVSPKHV